MNSLIINSANKVLDVILGEGDKCFCYSAKENAHHNEELLPLIESVLKKHKLNLKEIDKFGVVVGPGSFTGLRVGIATVKAFRVVTLAKAFSINNLDLLYALAKAQYKEFGAVAIAGSGNTYFVARFINGVVYKYDRNLTREELLEVASGLPIVMYAEDKTLKCLTVKMDAKVVLDCLQESEDSSLTPVYYQLSQAEREKLNNGELNILSATKADVDIIAEIEKEVSTSPLIKKQIEEMFSDKNYAIFKAELNKELVGFIILQFTDETNIVSVAVKKDYRNIGIASKLIERAEELSHKKGIKTLSLEVGYKNIPAYLLYLKLGFEVRRVRKNYYSNNDDCLEMAKNI